MWASCSVLLLLFVRREIEVCFYCYKIHGNRMCFLLLLTLCGWVMLSVSGGTREEHNLPDNEIAPSPRLSYRLNNENSFKHAGNESNNWDVSVKSDMQQLKQGFPLIFLLDQQSSKCIKWISALQSLLFTCSRLHFVSDHVHIEVVSLCSWQE